MQGWDTSLYKFLKEFVIYMLPDKIFKDEQNLEKI